MKTVRALLDLSFVGINSTPTGHSRSSTRTATRAAAAPSADETSRFPTPTGEGKFYYTFQHGPAHFKSISALFGWEPTFSDSNFTHYGPGDWDASSARAEWLGHRNEHSGGSGASCNPWCPGQEGTLFTTRQRSANSCISRSSSCRHRAYCHFSQFATSSTTTKRGASRSQFRPATVSRVWPAQASAWWVDTCGRCDPTTPLDKTPTQPGRDMTPQPFHKRHPTILGDKQTETLPHCYIRQRRSI